MVQRYSETTRSEAKLMKPKEIARVGATNSCNNFN